MAYEDDFMTSNLNPLESIHSIQKVDREKKREGEEKRRNKKGRRKSDSVEVQGVKVISGKREHEDKKDGITKGGKIDIVVR